ncbi:hypothetical protein [Ensifer soli]|uniref:hypothetical protein n=1 Tax=Ciceribacter sp. sgz301302 TaxID=3342379 RepID=UPI0035B836DD
MFPAILQAIAAVGLRVMAQSDAKHVCDGRRAALAPLLRLALSILRRSPSPTRLDPEDLPEARRRDLGFRDGRGPRPGDHDW